MNEPKDILNKKKTESFNTELDVLQRLLNVKTDGIKKDLNEDYILLHGSPNKEEFISNNLINAHFSKKLLERYKKYKEAHWNENKLDWERDENKKIKLFEIKEDDKKEIQKKADNLFNFFMLKSHSIAILNRNKEGNFILKLLGKYKEDEQAQIGYTSDDRSLLQKAVDGLKGKEEKDQEYD